MTTYKIRKDKINQFMAKKSLTISGFLLLGFIILTTIPGIMSGNIGAGFIVLWHFKMGVFMILAAMFLFTFMTRSEPEATRYIVGHDHIARKLIHGQVGAFTQYNLNKMERRHGQNQSEMIFHDEIASIDIKNNKITIKNNNYSMWNGNGRIEIPCEMEEYEVVKMEMIQLKKRLNA